MFTIRTGRADDLTSLAGFLEFKVPGLVVNSGLDLHVIFRGHLHPAAQERLLDRLIWAWRVEHAVETSADVQLSFVPDPAERQALAPRRTESPKRA